MGDRERRIDRAKTAGPADQDAAEEGNDRLRSAAMLRRKSLAPTSGGSALDATTQKRMEKSLGADLSGVRIHTDGEAAGRADSINARAYTEGADIHFGAGQFAPGSREGDRLLAHELTHVVQAGGGNRGGGSAAKAAAGGAGAAARKEAKPEESEEKAADESAGAEAEEKEVSSPDEPAEKEADAVADQVVDGDQKGEEKAEEKGEDQAAAGGEAKAVEKGDEKAPDGGEAKAEEKAEEKGDEKAPAGGDEKAAAEGDMGAEEKKEDAPEIQAKLDATARKVHRSAESRTAMHDKDKNRPLVKVDANKHAMAFEEKLGVEAMGNGTAKDATKKVTDQILQFLTVEASEIDEMTKELHTDNEKLDGLMRDHVGTPDTAVGVAGSVGNAPKALREVFAGGNLREQMTIVFNFLRHFNDVMTGASHGKRKEYYERAKINKTQIEGRITELAGPEGENQNQDGSLKKDKKPSLYKPAEKLHDQEEARVETANPDKGKLGSTWRSDRSANDLKGTAAELSPRELAQQGKLTGKSGEELMQQKLTWEEGSKRWAADANHTFTEQLQQMQLPFAGGPSGTTDRLFTTAEMVGAGVAPNDMRLACIGYLLPIHAHSLSEIMFSAEAHGADAPQPGLKIYSDIKPLEESFLRTTVGDGLLPHEHAEEDPETEAPMQMAATGDDQ